LWGDYKRFSSNFCQLLLGFLTLNSELNLAEKLEENVLDKRTKFGSKVMDEEIYDGKLFNLN